MQLIAVVLNCGHMFEEATALLDYGFECYKNVPIIEQGQFVQNITVVKGIQEEVDLVADRNFSIALNDSEQHKIRTKLILPDELEAPVEAGQWVGSLQIFLNNEMIEEIPIVTEQVVERRTILDFFRKMVNIWR